MGRLYAFTQALPSLSSQPAEVRFKWSRNLQDNLQSNSKTIPALFTIGYEQSRPDPVLKALKDARVQLLVDTRAVAASRKPGFSKRQLAASLDEIGIRYLHLQKLGTPAEGTRGGAFGRHERRSGASTTAT